MHYRPTEMVDLFFLCAAHFDAEVFKNFLQQHFDLKTKTTHVATESQ